MWAKSAWNSIIIADCRARIHELQLIYSSVNCYWNCYCYCCRRCYFLCALLFQWMRLIAYHSMFPFTEAHIPICRATIFTAKIRTIFSWEQQNKEEIRIWAMSLLPYCVWIGERRLVNDTQNNNVSHFISSMQLTVKWKKKKQQMNKCINDRAWNGVINEKYCPNIVCDLFQRFSASTMCLYWFVYQDRIHFGNCRHSRR